VEPVHDRLVDLEDGEGEDAPAEDGADHAPPSNLCDEVADPGQAPPCEVRPDDSYAERPATSRRPPGRRWRYAFLSPSTFTTITVRVLARDTPPGSYVPGRVRKALLGGYRRPCNGNGVGTGALTPEIWTSIRSVRGKPYREHIPILAHRSDHPPDGDGKLPYPGGACLDECR
jgi:hypothetical protein